MSTYVGLDKSDIPALYRNRAAEIADGPTEDKPVLTVMVEYYGNRQPQVIVLGNGDEPCPREQLGACLESIGVLSEAAATCNAQASN